MLNILAGLLLLIPGLALVTSTTQFLWKGTPFSTLLYKDANAEYYRTLYFSHLKKIAAIFLVAWSFVTGLLLIIA